MKVGIIGAGYTGLSAAYTLQKLGHEVTIFEKDSKPGGLAIGYKEKEWDWSLEKHYHHWFTNDTFVLDLAKEIGHDVEIVRPHTNWYVNEHIYAFDSVSAALRFPELSLVDRLRNIATLGLLRLNPFWKPLEKINADTALPYLMGKKAYSLLWEPLLKNKFGNYANDISLAWFWARIKKRTQSLAYPAGGFLAFAERLVEVIEKNGGNVHVNTELTSLTSNGRVTLRTKSTSATFDAVIVTTPSFLFLKLAADLPDSYKKKLQQLKGLGAINLILRLKKPFFSDNTYWLSIADTTSPIMAIVEHTNFMDKKYYGGEHLIYLGNYLPHDHPYFTKSKKELLAIYDPFLRKINPTYEETILGYEVFKAPFAQPIIPTNYSKHIPPLTTPLSNVFLANIEQVYPWDRGTNYAVELGEKVARLAARR